jgi:hypothetical protein
MLSKDWIIQEPHDIEYKQYIIMAYEQRCNIELGEQKIYPVLSEVTEHINIINKFIEGKKILEETHKELKEIDFFNGKLIYKSKIEDSIIDQFYDIAHWSISIFNSLLSNSKYIYDLIEKQIHIKTLIWNKSNFGYMILNNRNIYSYEIHKILNSWSINIEFIKYSPTIITELTLDYPIWNVTYPVDIPLENSILPITKRIILKKHIELQKS